MPSGAGHAVTAAADPITRCGRYGSSIGSGADCARTAAVTGPSPKPAVSARAERRALCPGARDSSCTHAVADPNTTPEHSPASARPAEMSASDREPSTSSSVARGDSATNGSTTGCRPKRSEAGPPEERSRDQGQRVDQEQPGHRARAKCEFMAVDDEHRGELAGSPAGGEYRGGDPDPGTGTPVAHVGSETSVAGLVALGVLPLRRRCS